MNDEVFSVIEEDQEEMARIRKDQSNLYGFINKSPIRLISHKHGAPGDNFRQIMPNNDNNIKNLSTSNSNKQFNFSALQTNVNSSGVPSQSKEYEF